MRTKSRASSGLKWEVSEDDAARRPKLQTYVVSFVFSMLWNDCMEVVLIRKRRPEWQKDSLNGVGGRVLENEPPYDAAVRTIKDECGIDVSRPLGHFARCVWTHSNIILDCYTGTSNTTSRIKSMTDEKVSRFGYPKVLTRKDLVSGVSWLLPLAIDFNLNKVEDFTIFKMQ